MDGDQRGKIWLVVGVLFLVFGLLVGLRFPDIDCSRFFCRPWIAHRSILTHGLLLPAFLYITFQIRSRQQPLPVFSSNLWRFCLLGFLLGSAVHLSFDLFPSGWYGYARVYVPLYEWTTSQFSIAWFAGSLLLCLYLGCWLLRDIDELYIAILALGIGFCVAAKLEPHISLPALLTLAGASCVAFILPRPAAVKATALRKL